MPPLTGPLGATAAVFCALVRAKKSNPSRGPCCDRPSYWLFVVSTTWPSPEPKPCLCSSLGRSATEPGRAPECFSRLLDSYRQL
eukprot:2159720-Alexandrium_andersonii.AAC.1